MGPETDTAATIRPPAAVIGALTEGTPRSRSSTLSAQPPRPPAARRAPGHPRQPAVADPGLGAAGPRGGPRGPDPSQRLLQRLGAGDPVRPGPRRPAVRGRRPITGPVRAPSAPARRAARGAA